MTPSVARPPLRVLAVEDVEDDVLLLAREIRRAGYDPVIERVDTAQSMGAALDRGDWDVVIADHALPQFNGLGALALLKQRDLDLPFILVSGAIDEETAVAAMRAGAHDYVMKSNLRRLAPAIQRELHEAQERRRRSEAERALEHERDYSRGLIEAANAMIVGLDPEGCITLFNRAAQLITGLARADVLGTSVYDALIPRDRWPVGWNAFHADAEGAETETEIPIRTSSGEERLISWRHSTPRGAVSAAGTLLFGIDVTERKRAEERRAAIEQVARRSEKLAALGTLAAGLAHELNNPVGIISSRVELMLLENADAGALPPGIREDLQVLHRHAQRVARLAHGLLSFARHTSGERVAVDLNRVVDEVLLLTQSQITKSGVTIRVGLHPALPSVAADSNSLQQVILNLVTNAWEALEGAGEIRIETRPASDAGGRVELVVEDTGRGIPLEDRERIFDPFFTTRPKGTGLGLSITHGIVREHGGTIHVESEPGTGTRFLVSFPRM